MRQSCYTVTAINDATGREMAFTTRAVLSNAVKAARYYARLFATYNTPVTVTIVQVAR
jgi:hypothetical protein